MPESIAMNFWVGLAVAVAVVVVTGGGSLMWIASSVSTGRVSPLATLNPQGAIGRALLVYHPGLSDFSEKVVGAFAEGLVQAGWRIDQTTASSEAPTDLAGYDLVALGSPVYGGLSKPMAEYIAGVGDFAGKPVVIILTGAGETDVTLGATRDLVETASGSVIESLAYTTMRPNESTKAYSGSNTDKAVAMARDAGKAIVLPRT
jgi:hypothetical protein